MYGTRFTMWGTDEVIKTLETMVKMAKTRLAQKLYPAEKEVARCLWVYTSYYFDFMGFFNWMEEKGYASPDEFRGRAAGRVLGLPQMDRRRLVWAEQQLFAG
jgi:hypothetical protein